MEYASVVEVQIKERAACPPWESAPNGVVSLLAMLEFSAAKYVEISNIFGRITGFYHRPSDEKWDLSNSINILLDDASALGLVVTKEHLGRMLVEMVNANPGKVHLTGDRERTLHIKDVALAPDRFCYHIESVYSTMKAELSTIMLKTIPRERGGYASGEWLKGRGVESRFPTSFNELERAASCYAVGQPTAAVFHSMRALEPAICALAVPFQVPTGHENWQNIIEGVEKKIRDLGNQPKTQQKIDDETFFGAAVSHLYFVKNAWRNHVAHARGSYSDDEALKVLNSTSDFVESLCPRLKE